MVNTLRLLPRAILLSLAVAFLLTSQSGAEESPLHEYTLEPTKRPIPTKPSEKWEIAPEIFYFFYEEPSLDVDWRGWLYGARASYTEKSRTTPWKGRLEVSYAIGSVDYDGSLSDGTPITSGGTDWFFNGRLLLGYDWALGRQILTPILGLGYRYWFDDLEGTGAYRRRVRYLYSPLGIETRRPIGKTWSFGIRGEYDLFWRGWVRSHLSDVSVLYNDLDNRQDTGYGVRGSFYLKREAGKKYTFTIEPFIQYWDIDDSNLAPLTFAGTLIGSGREPANKTIESGLRVSAVF